MCAHFMYADFMIFFTYGCLVRDDLIKKFKQTYQYTLELTHDILMSDDNPTNFNISGSW